jgi:hypothetical protein
MRAEGVSCSAGRRVALNRQPFFKEVLSSRNFERMYSKEQLERCRQQNHCPGNDKLCGEAVSFNQSLLLGSKEDTDKIADAFEKVYEHRRELA